MASRALSDKEQQYAARHGLAVRTFDVALDGVTVVVHADNPVEVLTLEQLREIFTRSFQPGRTLEACHRPSSSCRVWPVQGRRSYFANVFLGGADYSGTVQQMPTNEAIVTAVASQPWAIGYPGVAGAVRMARGRVEASMHCKPVQQVSPRNSHT